MNESVKEGIRALIKEHGKRNVRKAVDEIFAGWESERDKKRKEVAARLIAVYPGNGSRTKMEANIVKLLKKGITEEVLTDAVERYTEKLKMLARAGKKVPFEFVYKGHNFFGDNGYWRDFV